MKNPKQRKKALSVSIATTSALALAISLPISLSYLLSDENKQASTKVNKFNTSQNPNPTSLTNFISNNGGTNLLPDGSKLVSMPQKFQNSLNPSNWSGIAQQEDLSQINYSSPQNANLNVYDNTTISIAFQIPANYVENSNYSLNFYWTFLGNSKSPGPLANTDDANLSNRKGLGTLLPTNWMTNSLYNTNNGYYTLVSKLCIPQEYSPFFFNEHQNGEWQNLSNQNVAQYFNFVVNTGQTKATKYSVSNNANSVNTYVNEKQYIIRVQSVGISSKKQIEFTQNLSSTTNFLANQPIILTVNPYNTNGYNGENINKYPNKYQYKYQWFLNNEPLTDTEGNVTTSNNISGANTNTLTITNPSTKLNGSTIYCKVIGPMMNLGYDGSNSELQGEQNIASSSIPVFSNSNTTTLNLLTDFNLQSVELLSPGVDSSGIVVQGQNITLTANPVINPIYDKYLTYQWYFNNKAMSNQTSSTLVLNNLTPSNTGNYSCQVSLNWNNKVIQTKSSNVLSLNVENANNFALQLGFYSSDDIVGNLSSQAQNISCNSNTDLTFVAFATLGGNSLYNSNKVTYQWYKDGIMLQNSTYVNGVNSNTLNVNYCTGDDSGAYTCVATYQYSNGRTISTTSSPIYCTVNQNGAISIGQNLSNITVENGQSATLTVQASCPGTSVMNYYWKYKAPNSNNWVNIQNNSNSLQLTPQQTLKVNGYTFQCQMTSVTSYGWNTYALSNTATISVVTPGISILSQPIDAKNVLIGSNATFSVEAQLTGASNQSNAQIAYQWVSVDSQNKVTQLQGQTSPTLTINNVQSKYDGNQYMCYIYPKGVLNPGQVGKYTNVVTIDVLQPQITPSSLTIQGETNLLSGGSTTLSVSPKINYPELPNGYSFSYQWYKSDNGNDASILLKGETSSSLKLNNLNESDNQTLYWCSVSIINNATKQAVNTVGSRPAILNIDSLNSISIQLPSTVNGYVGGDATITSKVSIDNKEVSPSDKIKYQWLSSQEPTNSKSVQWQPISNANSSSLNVNNLTLENNNTLYALEITIGEKSFISSYPTTLKVYSSSYVVKLDSTNVVVNEKQKATITASVTQLFDTSNSSYSYQWYALAPNTQPTFDGNNITNGTIISGATKPTLTLEDVNGTWDGSQFYCVVSLGNQKQTSPLAKLTVEKCGISANELPYKITASNGQASVSVDNVKTSFEVSGASLKYQWQMSNGNGQWQNISDQTQATLELSGLKTTDNGEGYRCVITYADANNVYATYTTNPTTLIVNSNVSVNIQLADTINACVNKQLTINPEVTITGANISNDIVSYQWQKLTTTNGKQEWTNEGSSSDSLELTLNTITKDDNGSQYRLVVIIGNDTFISEPTTVQVFDNSFTVNTPSTIVTTNIGGNLTANVVAQQMVGSQQLNYTYQWYAVDPNSENEPIKLTNQTNATLTLSGVEQKWDNAEFYCVVTADGESVTSQKITLKVNKCDILYSKLPLQVLASNDSATFSVQGVTPSYAINGAQITYQWQKSNASTNNNWEDISGATSSTYTVSGVTSKDNGTLYRCKLMYGDYAIVFTNTSILTVNSSINVDIQLVGQINGCIGNSVEIKPNIKISGENLGTYTPSYQWQVGTKSSNSNDIAWSNIEGATQENLTIKDLKKDQDGQFYRLIATINGNTFTSDKIVLRVFDSPFVVNIAQDVVDTNIGSKINLAVSVSQLIKGSPSANYNYKWYVVPVNGNPSYVELPRSYNSSSITLNDVQKTWNGAKFYCVVSDGSSQIASDPINVTVNDCEITADSIPSIVFAENSKAEISVNGVQTNYNIANTSLTYQWQSKSSSGDWTDINGANSSTLNLNNLSYIDNGVSYRCVINYGNYATLTTSSTTLIVNTEANIEFNLPSSMNVAVNNSVSIQPNVNITGNNINPNDAEYQWKFAIPSTNGKYEWINVENGNQKNLTLSNVQKDKNGYLFKLFVTIGGKTYSSDTVVLNVYNSSFVVNTNQSFVTANIGGNLNCSVNVTQNITGSNDFTYQWYVTKNKDKSNSVKIPNATAATLNLNNVSNTWNDYYFYCVVSSKNDKQDSPLIQLRVNNVNLSYETLPNTIVVDNSTANLTVGTVTPSYNITNAKISYQWQVSKNGTWIDLTSQTGENLSLTELDSTNNGWSYRCKITYSNGNDIYASIFTNASTLVVNSNVQIVAQLEPFINTYVGANVTIAPNISINGSNLGSSTPTYQWQTYNAQTKTWDNVTINGQQENLVLDKVQANQNNSLYRIIVTLNGISFTSNSCSLNVYNSSFVVNATSQNVSTNIGQKVSLSVNVNELVNTNDTFTYKWYAINPQSSSNESVLIDGQNSNTLVLTNPLSTWNNAKFYCVVQSSDGSTQQSQNITLSINPCTLNVPHISNTSFVKNNSVIVSLGQVTPSYTIANTAISYQWQKYDENQNKWINVNNQTNNTLTLNNLIYANNGDMYRCAVSYGDYVTSYSNATILVVNSNWNVDIETPSYVNACVDKDITITPIINVTGENINSNALANATYQWMYSTSLDNPSWKNVEVLSANMSSLTLDKVTESMNNYYYRLQINVGGNIFMSNPIQLHVYNSSFVVNTPKNIVYSNIGQNQVLSVSVSNTFANSSNNNFTYQWYYSTSSDGKWVKIENQTNSTLKLNNPQLDWTNTKFYCAVTNGTETHDSPEIILSINPVVLSSINLNPTVVAKDGKATITLNTVNENYQVEGGVLSYQWYKYQDGNSWEEVQGQTSPSLRLTNLLSTDNGSVYRCKVIYSDGNGNVYATYTTNEVTVIVNSSASVVIKVPSSINVCENGVLNIEPIVDITSNSSNGQISYQWQYCDPKTFNTDNPVWVDISGQTNKNLTINNIPKTANGVEIQLLVTVGGSKFVSSSIKVNIVNSTFVVNAPFTHVEANFGSKATLKVNVESVITDNSSSVQPTYTYQWYYIDPRGDEIPSEDNPYANSVLIKNATSNTLVVNEINLDTPLYDFYCKVTQTIGDSSSTMMSPLMNIEANPCDMQLFDLPTTVFAKNSSITLAVKGLITSYKIPNAQFRYQWYVVKGNNYPEEIPGATNSTLELNNLTWSDNGNIYYCSIEYVVGRDIYSAVYTSKTTLVVNTSVNLSFEIPDEVNGCVGGNLTINPDIDIQGENLGDYKLTYQWQYVAAKDINSNVKVDNLPWENISGSMGQQENLVINNLNKNMDGYMFRLKIYVLGDVFYSNSVITHIYDSSYVVNAAQNHVSSGISQSASMSVSVNQIFKEQNQPNDYKYQWYVITSDDQINNGKYNGNLIKGANSKILTLQDVQESWNGLRFYCVVSLGDQQSFSPLIRFNVNNCMISVNDLPIFVDAVDGKTQIGVSNVSLNYQIKNTQLTYQWQKLNSQNQWVDIPMQTNATLLLNNLTQSNNGDVYRCKISYGSYASTYTTPTTLIVNTLLNINVQLPSEINVCLNGNVNIVPTINVSGNNYDLDNIEYQWKVGKMNSDGKIIFTDINSPSGKSSQLSLTNVQDVDNGNYYQLEVTIDGNSFTSTPTKLNVLSKTFVVNVKNDDVNVDIGQNVKLSVSIDSLINVNSLQYKYQWYAISNYSSYSLRTSELNGAPIKGATSPTLDINSVDSSLNGTKYYCAVSYGDETQYSKPIELNVNSCDITASETPIVYVAENGKARLELSNVKTSYEIKNAKLTYQWQVSTDNCKTWSNIDGANSNILELTNLSLEDNGEVYRCIVNYSDYSTMTSSPIVLLVEKQNLGPINPNPDLQDNTPNKDKDNAWIAIPVVFGGVAGAGLGVALYWLFKKRNQRWGRWRT